MEPLALDPGEYTGTYKLIGGRVSLDFVNTISWPDTRRQHDWLNTPANVSAWLGAVGLATGPVSPSDIAEIQRIRRTLSEVLRPLAHGERPSASAVGEFNQHIDRAQQRRFIDPVDLDWKWRTPSQGHHLLAPVILDAADLIVESDHSRLRHCPSCDWIFEDQSRNGRRRWCDMADCGSRAKARSYYERTKSQRSSNGV
jgi:predicted RNA-binding Zn ribbon-like protein